MGKMDDCYLSDAKIDEDYYYDVKTPNADWQQIYYERAEFGRRCGACVFFAGKTSLCETAKSFGKCVNKDSVWKGYVRCETSRCSKFSNERDLAEKTKKEAKKEAKAKAKEEAKAQEKQARREYHRIMTREWRAAKKAEANGIIPKDAKKMGRPRKEAKKEAKAKAKEEATAQEKQARREYHRIMMREWRAAKKAEANGIIPKDAKKDEGRVI